MAEWIRLNNKCGFRLSLDIFLHCTATFYCVSQDKAGRELFLWFHYYCPTLKQPTDWVRTVWYKLEFILNHDMSDIFGHLCDHNMQPLRPGQDCTTLWDYLKGLSPAQQVLSLEQRQLQLQYQNCCNGSKSTRYVLVCFLPEKVCQIS